MMDTQLLLTLLLACVGWSACCFLAGRIYDKTIRVLELRQAEMDEMNARDEWANRMEKGAA